MKLFEAAVLFFASAEGIMRETLEILGEIGNRGVKADGKGWRK